MTITHVQSHGVTPTGAQTSLVGTLPSGVTLGNLLVAVVAVANNVTTITPPSGWTQAVINQPSGTSATIELAIFWKVVGSGDAGSTSFTFTLGTARNCVIGMQEWSATNGWSANPVDQTAQGDTASTPAQSTSISSGTTATTAQSEELWVAGLTYKAGLQTESGLTSGWTKDLDLSSGGPSASVLYQVASATGTASAGYTIGTPEWWAGAVVTFADRVSATIPIAGTSNGSGSGTALTLQGSVPVPVPRAQVALAASYTVRVRAPNRLPAGQIGTYRKLSIVRRFNNISDWALEMDADDPTAALIATPGYGISVTRTIYDPETGKVVASRVEISGPTTGMVRAMANNTLTVHGKDDLLFISGIEAWPVTTYQYGILVAASSAERFYRLGEASGTTATDSGTAGSNGTYAGGQTLGLASLIDNTGVPPPTSISLTGTTGYITVPTAGLPTGNGAWTFEGIMLAPAAPASSTFAHLWSAGAAGTNSYVSVILNQFMQLYVECGTSTSFGFTVLSTGIVHHFAVTWDGTNLIWYIDGANVAQVTPGARNLSYGAAYIGRKFDGTNASMQGIELQMMAVYPSALAASVINTHAATAFSRFGAAYSDNSTGAAESVIKHYVSANCGPSAGFVERIVSGLSIEADAAQGASINATARFDKLVAVDGTGLLQTLATAGGVGFEVNTLNGTMYFHVYTPTDRTANIIFNPALGNIIDFTYTREAPDPATGGNVVVVGGGGVGANRTFQILSNSESLGTWWRYEMFLDARDTSDPAVMTQRGNAALDEAAEVDTFQVTLAPETLQMVYGVDFDLGDKVTAIVDQIVYQDLIREVDITLDTGQAEKVTPMVGTPNAVLIRDAMIKYLRIARRSDSASARLKTAQ